MKKLFNKSICMILMLSLFLIITSVNTVQASPANRLTSFKILGYADYQNFHNGEFHDKGDTESVRGSFVAMVTDQYGYGNIKIKVDGISVNNWEQKAIPLQKGSDGGVIAWRKILFLTNLSNGHHSIEITCIGTVYPVKVFKDTIHIDVQ